MKKTTFSILGVFLFLFLGLPVLHAEMQPCRGKMGADLDRPGMQMTGKMGQCDMCEEGPGHRLWQELKNIGLTDKQEKAIKEIGSRVKKETIKKAADLKVGKLELRDLLQSDSVDMKAVEAKLRQLATLKTDIILTRLGAFEEIKSQLTPEQKKKLKSEMENREPCEQCDQGMKQHHRRKGQTPPCQEKDGK